MKCPKCKNQIPNNVLRCPHCNLKVKIVCPSCKTISLMGKNFCPECGFKFFTKCENCQTVNLSTSKNCRKCGFILIKEPQTSTEIANTKTEELLSETVAIDELKQENSSQVVDEVEKDNKETVELPSRETDNSTNEENIEHVDEPQTEEENDDNEEETLNSEGSLSNNEELQITPDGYMISNDEIDISDNQFKNLLQTVEDLEQSINKKTESDMLIQQKFEKQEETYIEEAEEIPSEYIQLNQKEAQSSIIEAIQNPLKRIISLSGKEGFGKSLILKYVREGLREENYIWAWGECNALTQITPFGYIQDVLLNLFNLSNFSVNLDDFVKNNTKALEAQFFNLSPSEISDLFNFLYPVKESDFNGILKRKDYTINILKKVFENFAVKSMIVFVADDFENIDGASFDFLKNIISDQKFEDKVKLVITNRLNKIAQGYFYNNELKHNNYSNIFLSGVDNEQCRLLINTLFGKDINLPEKIENQIFENFKGTSSYIEQACLLLNEIGAIVQNEQGDIVFNHEFDDYILPVNTYRVLEERLTAIEKDYPVVVKFLYVASILGNKFSIHQFENVVQFLNITKDDYNLICNYLTEKNYITPFSENYFSFNNTLIWHYVYERAKADEHFFEFNKNIYASVKSLYLSNNSLKPLLLQNFGNKEESYLYWKKNAKLASYLGDTNLYVISLKQQLKISNDVTGIVTAKEKIQIYEKMGKILYKLSPKEAVNYISAAIAYYKEEINYNPVRIIELSAFLVQSCNILGDYLGVIEACDVTISALPDGEYEIEKALMASKKLKALLNIGNCEEISNVATIDLLRTIESALAKTHTSTIVSDTKIFGTWVETSLILANAYALQGNKKAFEILSKIDDAIVLNKVNDENKFIQKLLITKAFTYTMRGEIKQSSDILTSITSKYSTDAMDEEYILQWNFINILNKIITKDYTNIVDEMFQITTFADNINNLFTKNILKLLLGYIIQTKSKNLNKAVEIYNDEILFFSKEKIATGALLCWLLISNASLITQGVDFALDIAIKALDVAKGPKVNNYIFIIALKLLIADIYIIKHDFDATKMYLEKAVKIAKDNDLRFMQMLIYQKYGKYNEEMITVYPENSQAYAQAAADMYLEAVKLAQGLMLNSQESLIKKDLVSLKAFCQLKNIKVIIEED